MNTKSSEEKIQKLFKKNAVILAYLFGSHAQMAATQSSDVDIALLFKNSLTKRERFDKKCFLSHELSKIYKTTVDLVILNDTTSSFFKYVIIKEGRMLFEKSDDIRILFEEETLSSYFDFETFHTLYNNVYVKTGLQQDRGKTSTT